MTKAFIELNQNSHFTDVHVTKLTKRLKNPDLFELKAGKQFEYYIRAYYHYKFIQKVGGLCLFYTLTLNDNNLSHASDFLDNFEEFKGKNIGKKFRCFNYEREIRWLLNESGFDKAIKNEGCKLDYFITSELGSKNGRPHYHALFYLVPLEGNTCITPERFKFLITKYWHGYTSDTSPFIELRHKDAIRGIVQEGDNLGVVNSPAALSYVAKYVGKDVNVEKLTKKTKSLVFRFLYALSYNDPQVRDEYEGRFDPFEEENPLESEGFKKYVQRLVQPRTDEIIRKFRNHCTNRVRISQKFGLYALDFVTDDMKLPLPLSDKIEIVNLPLYIYRKLLYQYHDEDGKRLSYTKPLFLDMPIDKRPKSYYCVKNERFFQYRLDNLDNDINREMVQMNAYINMLKDRVVYRDFVSKVHPNQQLLDKLLQVTSIPIACSELYDYSLYNVVYRGRLFDLCCVPDIDIYKDYKTSLTDLYDMQYYSDESFDYRIYWAEREGLSLEEYIAHPRFAALCPCISLFDSIQNYFIFNKHLHDSDVWLKKREAKEFFNNIKFNHNLNVSAYGRKNS